MFADLRFALRGILRRPAHSALVVFTLALGLGINTVAFSSVNALVFRPFQIAGSDQFGWVFVGPPGNVVDSVSERTFDTLRTGTTAFDALAAEGRLPLSATSPAGLEQVWALVVSPDYFRIVPAPMRTGRALSPTDRAGDAVPVLLSERYWRTRWAAADIDTIRPVVNGQSAVVLGVVRDDFQGPGGIFEPHLWVPLDALTTLRVGRRSADDAWLTMIGMPKAGASPDRITAEVDAIAAALTPAGASAPLDGLYVPVRNGHPEANAIGRAALVALAAVGLVLLIACFNVAGLVLARSVERQRELGVRRALGASQMQLTRLLLVEGLVLATLAGAAALLLALWSEALLGGLSLPAPIPQRLHFAMDWRMVAFTAALVLVATLVPALTPAVRLARLDPIAWIRGAGSGTVAHLAPARTRRVFVMLQTAGATTFLLLAILFLQSYATTAAVDPGFDSTSTAALRIDRGSFEITPEAQASLVDTLTARLATTPGVVSVAVTDRLPFALGVMPSRQVSTTARDCTVGGCVSMRANAITPDFFATLDIAVRDGRTFDARRSDDRDHLVINVAAAQALWPDGAAVGRWLHVQAQDGSRSVHQVIGIVDTIVQGRFNEPPQPTVYRWLSLRDAAESPSIVVRHRAGADAGAAVLRDLWRAAGDHLPPATIETLAAQQALPLWPVRVSAAFFATCGVVAVILVMVGLFGVSYFSVAQRTREFGVRLALGATGADLRRLVLGESVRLMAPGLLLGLILAAAAATAARAMLVGASPLDGSAYALAVGIQLAVALLAAWLPARRAARTPPQLTMRAE